MTLDRNPPENLTKRHESLAANAIAGQQTSNLASIRQRKMADCRKSARMNNLERQCFEEVLDIYEKAGTIPELDTVESMAAAMAEQRYNHIYDPAVVTADQWSGWLEGLRLRLVSARNTGDLPQSINFELHLDGIGQTKGVRVVITEYDGEIFNPEFLQADSIPAKVMALFGRRPREYIGSFHEVMERISSIALSYQRAASSPAAMSRPVVEAGDGVRSAGVERYMKSRHKIKLPYA